MNNDDMKCICGYKYERDIGNEEYDKGDEPFIVSDDELNGVLYLGKKFYHVFACPKCGTLKINLGDE